MSRDDGYQTIQVRAVCTYVYNRHTWRLTVNMCVLREVVRTLMTMRKYSSPPSVTILPVPMRYRVNFSFHNCNYGISLSGINSAGHRAGLQTLEEDADDVDDGGLWFQQHGVIAHTARQSIACFERYVPWVYHFVFRYNWNSFKSLGVCDWPLRTQGVERTHEGKR
jgi:hypothetical protein